MLVPGAGLGRLVLECARRGYETEGNECSYYMLLTCSFMLNHSNSPDQFTVHPWIHGITSKHIRTGVSIDTCMDMCDGQV